MTNLFTMGLQYVASVCLLLSMADGNALRKATVPFNNVSGTSTSPKLTHTSAKETEERTSQQMLMENRIAQIQTNMDTIRTGGNVIRNKTESFNYTQNINKSTLLKHVLNKEIEGQIDQQMQLGNNNSEIQTQGIKEFTVEDKADPIVAFTATTKDELTAVSKGQIVPFVEVITNIGGGYDNEVGVFRCPIRGLYQFTVTIRTLPKQRVDTQLFVGGRGTVMTRSQDLYYHVSSTSTVLITVNRWENVYVRVHYVSSSAPTIGLSSTFSGFLIREI